MTICFVVQVVTQIKVCTAKQIDKAFTTYECIRWVIHLLDKAIHRLIVEIKKVLNACLLPLRGKVGMGVLLTLKSTAPPSLALGQSSALLFPSSSP
jgi:hypothetical protein